MAIIFPFYNVEIVSGSLKTSSLRFNPKVQRFKKTIEMQDVLHCEFQSDSQNVMKYDTHITQEQRYQIHALLQSKVSQNRIAQIIGVNKSSISR